MNMSICVRPDRAISRREMGDGCVLMFNGVKLIKQHENLYISHYYSHGVIEFVVLPYTSIPTLNVIGHLDLDQSETMAAILDMLQIPNVQKAVLQYTGHILIMTIQRLIPLMHLCNTKFEWN